MPLRSERGSVLIQVAVALLALLALASFVFDHGVQMSGRGQAQNAADAGALAGAQSLALNQGQPHAWRAAHSLARENLIAADPLTSNQVSVDVPIHCPPPFSGGAQPACIKVNVNTPNVPTFLARLANVNSQGVSRRRRMACAGNATSCMRPWFTPDLWQENSPPTNMYFCRDTYRLRFPVRARAAPPR